MSLMIGARPIIPDFRRTAPICLINFTEQIWFQNILLDNNISPFSETDQISTNMKIQVCSARGVLPLEGGGVEEPQRPPRCDQPQQPPADARRTRFAQPRRILSILSTNCFLFGDSSAEILCLGDSCNMYQRNLSLLVPESTPRALV